MRKLTHEEFLEKLYEKNEYYRRGEFAVEGEYEGLKTKILVVDTNGISHLMTPDSLLRGGRFGVESAVDKNDYVKSMFYELHGDRFNYDKVEYKSNAAKVTMGCSIHGDFLMRPSEHMNGAGCQQCSVKTRNDKNIKDQEIFIKEAISVHGDKYNYDSVVYVNSYTKCDIFCKKHGLFFSQTPGDHVSGRGCMKCAREKMATLFRDRGYASYSEWGDMGQRSKKFDSFKFYVVVCKNNAESFIKVGKTFTTIDRRFKYIPYEFDVHKLIIDEDFIKISKIEQDFKNNLKSYNYKPSLPFGGQYECFHLDALHSGAVDELIKNYTDVSG
jgi:hypothetical protein